MLVVWLCTVLFNGSSHQFHGVERKGTDPVFLHGNGIIEYTVHSCNGADMCRLSDFTAAKKMGPHRRNRKERLSMLCCKNLRLVYPDGEKTKTVLDNVDITVKKGENVILLGPSGSGKSSLIYLLSSLRLPTAGEVIFNDMRFSEQSDRIKAKIRKEHFGFIFQMHFLLPYLSVAENVLLGSPFFNKQSRSKAEELLDRLGLSEHMGKKIHQMSGGQRQRVAIARAIMNEPDIIFADEPTASLDHETACEVIRVLKSHKQDSVLIMATHDTSILSGDERIIKVADGKTTEAV